MYTSHAHRVTIRFCPHHFLSSPIFSCAIRNSLQRSCCRFGLRIYQPPRFRARLGALVHPDRGLSLLLAQRGEACWPHPAHLWPILRIAASASQPSCYFQCLRDTSTFAWLLLTPAVELCGSLALHHRAGVLHTYICGYRLCRRVAARTLLRAPFYQPIKKRKEWLACMSHVHVSRRWGGGE